MALYIGNSPITKAYLGSTAVGVFLGEVNILDGDGPIVVVPGAVTSGMNIAGLNYWTSEFPFNNLLRKAGTWRAQEIGASYGSFPLPPMSEDNYPLSITPNHYVETIVSQNLNTLGITGPLHLRFDGDDTYDDNFWQGNIQVGWPVQMTKVGDNHYTLNLNGATDLTLRIFNSDPQDPIRNIRVLVNDNNDVFRPQFLARQDGMRVLRYMDLMVTNNSPIQDFEDYPRMSSFPSDASGYDRVPLEILCNLSNTTNIAPWFCVPHLATDEFIIEMARKITKNLTVNVPVYIEYSNECWNSMFDQYAHCITQGNALNLPGDNQWIRGAQYYGLRTKQIEEILRPIFGTRLKMIYSWQAVNSYFGGEGIGYQDVGDHIDVCAIAPYFGSSLGDYDYPPDNPHSQQVKDGGLPFVFSYLEENIDTVLRAAVQDWVEIADQYNTEIWCYEAGQHLVGVGPSVDDEVLRNIFQAANRDPRMGEAYNQFIKMWNEETPPGSLIAWYVSMSVPGHSGIWGLMEHEQDVNNVKWLAVSAAVDDTEPNYPTYPPYQEVN